MKSHASLTVAYERFLGKTYDTWLSSKTGYDAIYLL
jgi:hypothetical protein